MTKGEEERRDLSHVACYLCSPWCASSRPHATRLRLPMCLCSVCRLTCQTWLLRADGKTCLIHGVNPQRYLSWIRLLTAVAWRVFLQRLNWIPRLTSAAQFGSLLDHVPAEMLLDYHRAQTPSGRPGQEV